MRRTTIRIIDRVIQRTLDYRYQLLKDAHELRAVSIEVTGKCNLRCLHCYADSSPDYSKQDLSLDHFRSLCATLRTQFKNVTVSITGGEPLIRPDILDVLRLFRREGFSLAISTNGTLVTPPMARELSGIVSAASVSLDGLEGLHNHLRQAPVFQKTIEGIRSLISEGVPYVAVKTTVSTLNLEELDSLRSLIEDLGVHEWHLFPLERQGRGGQVPNLALSHEQYLSLSETILRLKQTSRVRITFGEEPYVPLGTKPCDFCKYRRCHAGISTLAILPDGAVTACINNARRPEQMQGNIISQDLREIWEDGFKENRARSYRACGIHSHEE